MKKLPMAVTLISFVTVLAFPMALMAQTDDNAPAAVDVDEGTAEPAPNLDLTVDGAEPDAVAIALADDPEKPLTPGQKYKKFFER